MSREDSSITYSSLLLMAKIEVTSLAFFLSCSFSLRFINQSRANREGTIAKLCVVEAETWVQSYFTHCLSVTWLSTQIFSPRKETKSIGLWRRFLSEARLLLLSILYTTFITICPTLFSSKTLAKVLRWKNGDISVEFLPLNSISIQHETQKKGRLHKRGLSRRHCSTATQRPLLNYCFGLKENSKGPFCQENYISLYKKRGRKLCCWHQRVFHLHTETNCYLSFS